jgi:hypothetical protein
MGANDMADRFQGVLRASIQMALAFRSPMTARQIAAYITHLNRARPFSGADVDAVLRSDPNLFVIESRGFLGLGGARWGLRPATSAVRTDSLPARHETSRTPDVVEDADAAAGAKLAARYRKLVATKGEVQARRMMASIVRAAPPAPVGPQERPVTAPAPTRRIELIDDEMSTATDRPRVSAERRALDQEIKRRRARRGRAPATKPGQVNYRDVIDTNHPINRLSDETLNRMAADVHVDSE